MAVSGTGLHLTLNYSFFFSFFMLDDNGIHETNSISLDVGHLIPPKTRYGDIASFSCMNHIRDDVNPCTATKGYSILGSVQRASVIQKQNDTRQSRGSESA